MNAAWALFHQMHACLGRMAIGTEPTQCGRLRAGPQGCKMPAPRGKLTDLREIAAYVLAHAAGIAWGLAVNPMIFRSLFAQGYRDHFLLAAIALTIAVSVVVLLIFLFLRKAMGRPGAPT